MKIRIGTKLALGFGSVAAIAAVAAMVAYVLFQRVLDTTHYLAQIEGPQQAALIEIEMSFHEMVAAVSLYGHAPEERYRHQFMNASQALTSVTRRFFELAEDEGDFQGAEKLEALHRGIDEIGGELMALADTQRADRERLDEKEKILNDALLRRLPAAIELSRSDTAAKTETARDLEQQIMEALAGIRSYLISPDAEEAKGVRGALEHFARVKQRYHWIEPSPADAAILEEIGDVSARFVVLAERLITNTDRIRELRARIERKLREADDLLDDVLQTATEYEIQDAAAEARRSSETATLVLSMLALLAVGAAAGGGFHFSRSIGRQVRRLSAAAGEIGRGSFGTVVPVETNDEIGSLALAINRMSADLEQSSVSREHLDGILSALAEAVIVVALDGTILSVNPATARLTQFHDEALVGTPLASLFADEGLERDLLEEVERATRVSGLLTEFRVAGGGVVPVLVSAAIRHDRNEGAASFVVSAIDYRSQANAEKALQQSEARIRALIENAPTKIHIKDLEGRYVLINPKSEELFGISQHEAKGKTAAEIFPEMVSGPFSDHDLAVRESGEAIEREETFNVNGKRRLFRTVKFPIRDDDDRLISIGGIGIDITRAKQIEEALRLSEQRFRDFTAAVSDWFWETDAEGRFTFVSERFFNEMNVERDNVFGHLRQDFVPKDEIRAYPDKWRRHAEDIENHQPFRNLEYAIVGSDGGTRHIRVSGIPIFDYENNFLGYRGADTDVTQAKQTEEALRLSENRFRMFAELGSDWFWETDEKHRFTKFIRKSTEAEEEDDDLTQIQEDSIGKTRWEVVGVNPKRDPPWQQHRATLEAHEPFRNFRYGTAARDGSTRYLNISGRPAFLANGKFAGYCGTGTDETALFEAEARAKRAHARLADAIESIEDGFALFNAKDRLALCNNRFREMLGPIADKAAEGTKFSELVQAASDAGLFAAAEDEGEGANVAKEILDAHREARGVEMRPFADGRWLEIATHRTKEKGTVNIWRDVTDRVRQELRQRQGQKMESLGTLAGGIAHDFNNLLVPMLGLTDLTLRVLPGDSPMRANLEKVMEAGQRAKALIERILAFSRQKNMERKPLALDLLIEETMTLLRSTLPSSIAIRLNVPSGVGFVMADSTQMHQVLMNLCSNASHAMAGTNGVLEVTLSRVEIGAAKELALANLKPGWHARISVGDTGKGMDKKTVARIFEPYFTTKAVGKGTGIGLSVVHGIVNDYDGAIAVESEPGVGSRFDLYFPIVDGVTPEAAQDAASETAAAIASAKAAAGIKTTG